MDRDEWIPVTERLPNAGEIVAIALMQDGEYMVSVDILKRDGTWLLSGFNSDVTITHWIALSKPPKEVVK